MHGISVPGFSWSAMRIGNSRVVSVRYAWRTLLLITVRNIRNPESDMAKLPAYEFWKQQFDLGGNLTALWVSSASDLLTAADVLNRFKGDILGEIVRDSEQKMTKRQQERLGVSKVIAMLRAMATECLLKALWLKYGEKLAANGKYSGVLKKNEHDLHVLAKAVSEKSKGEIDFPKRELDLLEQASYWISSGRYPIQKKYSHLVPFSRPDGTLVGRQFWQGGDPVEELGSLIVKLQTALGFVR